MRTRRFANVEKLRSKERRLLEVLRRQEEQKVLDLFPLGLAPNTPLSYSASVGGSTVAVYAPLQALVHVGEQTFVVDQSSTPDPTGGFADVVIEAGKQIGELKTDQTLSMAGKSAGTYITYATHNLADEQAETRYPPGKYAEGEGVFTEHASFYSHGQATGTAIPRNNYDGSLSSQTVSEAVDRLVISVATEASVPSTATKLLKLQWDGSQITSITNISETVDINELRAQVITLEGSMTTAEGDITSLEGRVTTAETDINSVETDLTSHIGSRGSAHGNSTTSVSGFMSSVDKEKLDTVEQGAERNPDLSDYISEGMGFSAPQRFYVVTSSGAGQALYAQIPPNWTVTRTAAGKYKIDTNNEITARPAMAGNCIDASGQELTPDFSGADNSIYITTWKDGLESDSGWTLIVIG